MKINKIYYILCLKKILKSRLRLKNISGGISITLQRNLILFN